MENLKILETRVLLEMLAKQTEIYTSKIVEKNSVELQQFEYEVSLIQSEINSR